MPQIKASLANAKEPEQEQSFRAQLGMMQKAFLASPARNTIIWLSIGIFVVIVAIALGQILLNRWYKPFYDTLERRDLAAFLRQFIVFGEIAGVLLVLNVLQTWLNQWVRIKLREGLTMDLVNEWMRPGRAFKLANAGAIGVNPDQRVHEDARHLADLSSGLAIGLVQSGILLVSFVGVLWSLSSGFVFHFSDYSLNIPGYMVWAAFLYAGIASWLSWLVGRPLVRINGEHYSREAALRFSMMRVNEHIEAISLSSGESNEKRRLQMDLNAVLDISRELMMAMTRLTWVTAGYGWITVIAPIVIAAPVYFSGGLTFGGLMMAVGAFTQVHASLRWFVDNIGSIADWRATLLRVAAFRSALIALDDQSEGDKRIAIVRTQNSTLTLERLEIATPGGTVRTVEPLVEVAPGDRILVTGKPDVEKSPFFRALAGLWPFGTGRITLPDAENIAFIPRLPYFPPGTLEETLAAPRAPGDFSRNDLVSALTRVGLSKLAGTLDQNIRSSLKLNDNELKLLAIARIGLHKPRFIIIDETLDGLDHDTYRILLAYLDSELAHSAIINIGRPDPGGRFFTRTLQLENSTTGDTLRLLRPRKQRVLHKSL